MRRSFLSEYIIFLRWCLHPAGNIPACTSTINWQELLAFAKKQTIVGIYWQGIQRLGDIPNKPSEDDVMDWMGAYTKIVRRNVKTDDAVAKLTKIIKSNLKSICKSQVSVLQILGFLKFGL